MSLFPEYYKNYWSQSNEEWFTYYGLKLNDPPLHNLFTNYDYDDDLAIIFLSKNLSDKEHEYAIVFCGVVANNLSYYMETLGILGYTNDNRIDFDLNPSPLSKQITNYKTLDNFQYQEKFYIGECETISKLKTIVTKILKVTWVDDSTIIAF